ncbi:16S rRNA (adenine(1518)-N(6)/adenine(1519)-N(6))-dimethyltransferase RsmA [Hydrogenobacter thermophilus]|uniref:16S rRNA (adenine(1518)-N(6)/adenine(1519)-N(6))- dimethyltransferase RsmA n=1 Tax=Hydrogenobacter thermophilus TaxID=940 RepID=UPI0030F63E9D
MRLKKRYGQHILLSKGVIKAIVERLSIQEGDILLEIGPGTGNLTRELLNTPLKKLYLIEIDPQMVHELKKIEDDRVEIFLADATQFDICSLGGELKLVGNLPYNVASLIVENTVIHRKCIPFALFMLQKEVAEKLLKGPSWLSTFVRTFYDLNYVMSVPARFFFPKPKVQSALLEFVRKPDGEMIENEKDYKRFLTKLYSMRRKAIKSKIEEDILKMANIDPLKRVEELSVAHVLLLYNLSKTHEVDKK